MSSSLLRSCSHFLRCLRRSHPPERTAPLDQLFAVRLKGWQRRGHTHAPQRLRACEERVRLLANVVPERGRTRCNHQLAAEATARICDGGTTPRQSHAQHTCVPHRCRKRQRLSCPVIETLQRFPVLQIETQRELCGRLRQDLHRYFEDDTEHAERTDEQTRKIVARHVLHDAAAEGEHFTPPVHHPSPKHEIAHAAVARTVCRAARTSEPRSNTSAQGCSASEMRRLERKHLAALGQRALQLRQRSSSTRRDDRLTGLVCNHTRVAARIENGTGGGIAVEILRATGANSQRSPLRRSLAHRLAQSGNSSLSAHLGDHQYRGSSANGSFPELTRMRPYSAQRCSVGITLPGFNNCAGSKARLTATNASRVFGSNCEHI